MVDHILVDLGYLDSCIVIAPPDVKFDTKSLCNNDTPLQPTNGTLYEGWLVDEGGSGYMLSLGRVFKEWYTYMPTIRWSIPTHTPNS